MAVREFSRDDGDGFHSRTTNGCCAGGGIIALQVFPANYAHDGYQKSFIVCTACITGAMVSGGTLWYLTKGVERDVRIEAEGRGEVWRGVMMLGFLRGGGVGKGVGVV